MSGPTKRGVVIVGATSAIARGVARACAERGDRVVVAGRDLAECDRIAADLRTRWRTHATALHADLEGLDACDFAARCEDALEGAMDALVCCQGFMADQADAQNHPSLVRSTVTINLTSVIELCEAFAPRLRTEGGPGATICVVSSVAGDRGRPSNHIYGSSKAGLNAYLVGLNARLHGTGVNVLTVKPGFTDTAMTWGQEGMFLVASPTSVGNSIVRAIDARRATLYTPFFWRWIMLIIRCIPGPIFRRLDL